MLRRLLESKQGECEGDIGDHPVDPRSGPQVLHDSFTSILTLAADSAKAPSMGGGSPCLVVQVREVDLVNGTGWASVEGDDTPVPLAAARRAACTGTIERVTMTDTGRITSIETEERLFNRAQRRAIALRDGGCIIPGCGVPAAWCEIHHVTPWAEGGKTTTDNGVTVCTWHHRQLDRHEWDIRMCDGVPEVQAPPWFDPTGTWRPVTRSHTRRLDAIVRRQ